MINFEFRAHPTMFFKIIKPYLFVLILPFARAFLQYVTKGEVRGTIALEFIAVVFISVLAFCGWKAFKISVKKNKIIVEKGFLIKSRAAIELSCVSSMSVRRGVLDLLTGSVTCLINTEAGRLKKNDFELKLYKKDAKILEYLIYGVEKGERATFSFFKIVILSAATSSIITGFVVGFPIISRIEELINVAISKTILSKIDVDSSEIINVFPNLITIVFVLAYITSFLFSLFKKLNFGLIEGKEVIKIRSGLITKKETLFKKDAINNLCFEQTAVMRLLKKQYVRASIAGYGDNKGESATVVPLADEKDVKKHTRAYFKDCERGSTIVAPKKDQKTLNRFLYIPGVIFVAVVSALLFVAIKTSWLGRPLFGFAMMIIIVDLYHASVCYQNWKSSHFCPGDIIEISGAMRLKIRRLFCKKERVGVIKLSQTPIDRLRKTCKLKLTMRSESADSVKVKNLNIKATIKSINDLYKINIEV